MSRAVVLLTRDLRTRDHPALAAATRDHDEVVPLFALDDRQLRSANRVAFLLDSLSALRDALDGALVVRRGEAAAAAASFRPDWVYVTADGSAFAQARELRLRTVARLRVSPGASVIEPGALAPTGGDHYRVFTPYWRAWSAAERRPLAPEPVAIRLPPKVSPGELPALGDLLRQPRSPVLLPGGEPEGRRRLARFLRHGLRAYGDERDALELDGTSRLSPYLRFGCLSPLEVASRAEESGGDEFVRQLAWRDFYLQLLAAFPRLTTDDYRPRGREWRADDAALEAWKSGRTGIPIVDAGMRQLVNEGWMPNRVRMLAASLLVKNLGIHWRAGAAHFSSLLVDGDPASNAGNWQWVAGTGTDTRPNRVFNPIRQAHRFDPDGGYVRRHVHELADLEAPDVHEPWRLGPLGLAELGYPPPVVELGAPV
ncbi:MAG: deoxyribodipyrimidine photo-lyase [Gaiellaceae bacterium]